MNRKALTATLSVTALLLSLSQSAQAQPRATVVSAACTIKPAVDTFIRYLGPTKYTAKYDWSGYQSQSYQPPRGYRHITWDGIDSQYYNYDYLPANYYNSIANYGLILSTPGKGFRVSGDAYAYLNPSYASQFKAWSPNYLLSPIYSNVVDASFEVPGYYNDRGWVHGFGAVFADVDKANVTRMEFFDANNYSLGTWYVPPCNYGHSFLGVYFQDTWITKVRIWLGDKAMDAYVNDDAYNDVVALDDLIYDEPWRYGWKPYAAAPTYTPPAPAYTAPAPTYTPPAPTYTPPKY